MTPFTAFPEPEEHPERVTRDLPPIAAETRRDSGWCVAGDSSTRSQLPRQEVLPALVELVAHLSAIAEGTAGQQNVKKADVTIPWVTVESSIWELIRRWT